MYAACTKYNSYLSKKKTSALRRVLYFSNVLRICSIRIFPNHTSFQRSVKVTCLVPSYNTQREEEFRDILSDQQSHLPLTLLIGSTKLYEMLGNNRCNSLKRCGPSTQDATVSQLSTFH